MNKDEFLEKLANELEHIPPQEIVKAIAYYKESIEDRVDDGMSEEEAIKSLGEFDEIIKNIEDEISFTSVVKDKIKNTVRKNNDKKALTIILTIITFPIWFVVGVVVLSVIFAISTTVISVFIALMFTYLGLCLLGIMSLVLGMGVMFTETFYGGLLILGVALLIIGIGIALSPIVFWVIQGCIKVFIVLFKKLKKMIMRKG